MHLVRRHKATSTHPRSLHEAASAHKRGERELIERCTLAYLKAGRKVKVYEPMHATGSKTF